MNIVILGAGRVGESVAESLVIRAQRHHRHRHRPRAPARRCRTGSTCAASPATASSRRCCATAGVEDADLLIACAPLDETNLVACKIAHDLFNVPTTIARVRSPEFRGRRADDREPASRSTAVICPEESLTDYIRKLIEYPEALQVLEFAEGLVSLVAVRALERRADGAAQSSGRAAAARARRRDAHRRDLPPASTG